MKICPTCRYCYEDTEAACARDPAHAPLVPARAGSCVIAERYRLVRLLGRGGMGAVYAGTHVELERPAAIKLLLPDLLSDAQALERFRREARTAARLNHPNVADTYDYGILPGGEAYIVMELVEGQTLREYLNASGLLEPGEAVAIARQVADGIEAAHRSGIVHRDLKPSNIILSRDHHGSLQAKVVDFGIAKLKEYTTSGVLTNTGSLIGTPRYMSPEQCAGHDIDARSDIYSLGVILYELLAGRPPFDAQTPTAIALKHVQEQPPPLRPLRPELPEPLAALVMRALNKEPDARPQTAAELARALRPFERPPAHAPEGAQPVASESDDEVKPSEVRSGDGAARRDAETSASFVHTETSREGGTVPPREKDLPDTSRSGSPTLEASDARRAATLPSSDAAPPARARASAPLVVAALVGLIGLAAWFLFWRNGSNARTTSETGSVPVADRHTTPAPPPVNTPAHVSRGADNTKTAEGTESDGAQDSPAPAAPVTDASSEAAERRALSAALDSWVASSNARDLERHMAFYLPRLETYYRSAGVPLASVRRDKSAVLAQARSVHITAGAPSISFSPDGRTAMMEFRKQYAIEGGSINSAGEVVQELVWRKTPSGWRILSERDKRVIR